ncbi:histidine phosphatase family protein [Jeotgalibacillus proteolyticus]|uniref:Histidine phosphatase family protein n=1 Tax=Jeotgalibacillus proteolyticus TaxID=2082395 RepID=A0A2S5GCH0_9BACL|nr:histidine phosphatase family protein [Jeotgalibacillus proteolyticus]PPA70737.1 histidine phosphatase family protein [Jeotgalibacillus proteolyticus]
MTRITFVRHGETEWNALGKIQGQTDIPLNNQGVKQAQDCANVLKKDDWHQLISSPLKRAKHTAQIINRELKLELLEMSQFMEKHFGDAEGLNKEARFTKYPDKNYPNQESTESLQKRIKDGIDTIHQQFTGKEVLVVAHGGVINAILSMLSNEEKERRRELVNGGITTIYFEEDQFKIGDVNKTAHLSDYSEKGAFTTDALEKQINS